MPFVLHYLPTRCSSYLSGSPFTSAPLSFPTRRSSDLRPGYSNFAFMLLSQGLENRTGTGTEFETLLNKDRKSTSELQSRGHLVCRLLLEKKNTTLNSNHEATTYP